MSDVSIRAVARNIFRWAKTVNRKTLLKRFGLRTVLSKNQFGAHDRRETVWRRSHSLFPYGLFKSRLSFILSHLSLKNGHSSYYIDFIGLFGHNDPYNRIYPTALKGDALRKRTTKITRIKRTSPMPVKCAAI